MKQWFRLFIPMIFVIGFAFGFYFKNRPLPPTPETPVQKIEPNVIIPETQSLPNETIQQVEVKPSEIDQKQAAQKKEKPKASKKPAVKQAPPKLAMLTTKTQDLDFKACQDQIKRLKKANDSYIPSINIVATPNLFIEKFWTRNSVILITCNNYDRKMTTLVTPNK